MAPNRGHCVRFCAVAVMSVALVILFASFAPVEEETVPWKEVNRDKPLLTLRERVDAALSCVGQRANILDILAGAPYEFIPKDSVSEDVFMSLPRLAKKAMGPKRDEAELQLQVYYLVSEDAGWPVSLKRRLLAAIDSSCASACSSANRSTAIASAQSRSALQMPLGLEVDSDFTSSGAVSQGSGPFHQALLRIAAFTGIPSWRRRADMYLSRPPDVILSRQPIKPRDCLALRGNASVAFRIDTASGSAVIRQIVIEQPGRWSVPSLWSLPGRFEVWAELAEDRTRKPLSDDPYTMFLGSFAYVAAAPAPQAFRLPGVMPVRGLRILFKENSESFFCIYRVRAYEVDPPSCTEGDLVRMVDTVHL
jgi:hypothetical protein